jgi:hypothetical protein
MVANVPTTPVLETVAFDQTIVPREPDKVNVEPVLGIHKLSTPDIDPATDGSYNFTLKGEIVADVQTPLVKTTRYQVFGSVIVCVIVFAAFVAAVGAIALPTFVHSVLSVETCHWIVPTVPTAKVNVVVFEVEQTDDEPEIVLATTAGLTVTTKVVVSAQEPLVNKAL